MMGYNEMSEENKKVVVGKISKKKYLQLLKDQKKLNALMAAGVDNWEYYDDAMEAYRAELGDEDED